MPAKKTTTARKAGQKKKNVVKKASKKPTRKVSTKSSAKKTTKKVVRKAVKKSCACESKCSAKEAFWVNNGPVLHSVKDLLKALKEMSDEQFDYHTKRGSNDFASWIKECLKDSACATSVKRVRTRVGAVRVLSNKCSCK